MSNRFRRWRHIAIALFAVAGIALALRIVYVDRHPESDARLAVAGAVAVATVRIAGPVLSTAAVPPSPTVPPDVPAEEWARMKAALESTPDGQTQLPRIGAFLGFGHRVERWEALRQRGEHGADMQALARELLAELPGHVHLREITALEANALMTQLIMETVSDPAQQSQALAAAAARLREAAPAADPQMASQLALYRQQEAEITAQWMALSPAERDQRWLESRLDAARRSIFDGDASSP